MEYEDKGLEFDTHTIPFHLFIVYILTSFSIFSKREDRTDSNKRCGGHTVFESSWQVELIGPQDTNPKHVDMPSRLIPHLSNCLYLSVTRNSKS